MHLRGLYFIYRKANVEGPDTSEISTTGTAECDRTGPH